MTAFIEAHPLASIAAATLTFFFLICLLSEALERAGFFEDPPTED